MLRRKLIPFEELKYSTQKYEYVYLYERDDEKKTDNNTVEKEGVVEYGNDFIIGNLFTTEIQYKYIRQCFWKYYHWKTLFKTFSTLYIMS